MGELMRRRGQAMARRSLSWSASRHPAGTSGWGEAGADEAGVLKCRD